MAGSNNSINVGYGTSGQLVKSNGAGVAPGYTTATYPSTATGTGTILRADGTNWVASTATYPNTAGTSGNVLTSDGTNWSSTAPASGFPSLGYRATYYYTANIVGLTNNTASVAILADEVWCVPFLIAESSSWDTFAYRVTTAMAATKSLRIGIYNLNDGFPGTVLATLGTVVSDATGIKTLSITQTLASGYYFMGVQAEANVSLRGAGANDARGLAMPNGTSFLENGVGSFKYTGKAYGSGLPDLTASTPTLQAENLVFQLRSA